MPLGRRDRLDGLTKGERAPIVALHAELDRTGVMAPHMPDLTDQPTGRLIARERGLFPLVNRGVLARDPRAGRGLTPPQARREQRQHERPVVLGDLVEQ